LLVAENPDTERDSSFERRDENVFQIWSKDHLSIENSDFERGVSPVTNHPWRFASHQILPERPRFGYFDVFETWKSMFRGAC
jgi:hypothetical protein